jgi:hypothetical protein
MAFVVEDGSGLADATSYVSVADAGAYFAVDPNVTDWETLTLEQQQQWLNWATRLLDQKVIWAGYPTTTMQALRWPRTGVINRDGLRIASDEIPRQLVELVCEFVKFIRVTDPTAGSDIDQIQRLQVDVIEIEFQEDTAQPLFPSIIGSLLIGLGKMRSGLMGFGRVIKS